MGQKPRPSNLHDSSRPAEPSTTESYTTESIAKTVTKSLEEDSSEDDSKEILDYDEDVKKDKFIVPTPISDIADSFTKNEIEYIIVQDHVQHLEAGIRCKLTYNGSLAFVKNETIANFLAEALSETNLELDSLWVGGENISNVWYWKWESSLDPIDIRFFNSCIVENPYIDQKKLRLIFLVNEDEYANDTSTHKGWIKIGLKFFKIYYSQVSWEGAVALCPKKKANATLAIVTTNKEAQILGRYMLIGRPSLENAWIAAKYAEQIKSYYYINTDIILSNKTEYNFPPWKNNEIERLSGCILLDRHISNSTVFLEARCDRLRSYICSIDDSDSSSDGLTYTDVIIGEVAYRLIHNKKPWEQAFLFCEDHYKNYHGKLAVIHTYEENFHLLYVMGENHTDVQHLWIGGKYINGVWKWVSTDKDITLEYLNMIENTTYIHDVEERNLCLNMDRENHMIGFHYGTDCMWPQAFVCTFEYHFWNGPKKMNDTYNPQRNLNNLYMFFNKDNVIAYSPITNFTNTLITSSSEVLGVNASNLKGFNNETTLNEYLRNYTGSNIIGVVFLHLTDFESPPSNLYYVIRPYKYAYTTKELYSKDKEVVPDTEPDYQTDVKEFDEDDLVTVHLPLDNPEEVEIAMEDDSDEECHYLRFVLHYKKKQKQVSLSRVTKQWIVSNLFTCSYGCGEGVTVGDVLIMFIIDTILYLLTTLIVEKLIPGPYGIAMNISFSFKSFSKLFYHNKRERIRVGTNKITFYKVDVAPNLTVGIRIKNLSKKYGRTVAISDVTMDIYKGEIITLLGHSGAGKTTLMCIVAGMLSASTGGVYIQDRNLRRVMNRVKVTIGYCHQKNLKFLSLSVREHLVFFGILKGLSVNVAYTSANVLLARLNLYEHRHQKAYKLSDELQRKLSFAIALSGNPKILILDEPTFGLDSESRREVWEILKSMRSTSIIFISTRNMEEAQIFGDRIAVICNGRLICYGPPAFLKKEFGANYRLQIVFDEAWNELASVSKVTFRTTINSRDEEITNIIHKIIPTASFQSKVNNTLNFSLPYELKSDYSKLLDELDLNMTKLSIKDIKLKVNTIEDVFMRVDEMMLKYDDTDGGLFQEASAILKEGHKDIEFYKRHLVVAAEFNMTDNESLVVNAMYSTVATHGAPISLSLIVNTILKLTRGENCSISAAINFSPSLFRHKTASATRIPIYWTTILPFGIVRLWF
ncbi:hypothetical protein RN001_000142 [Aquatica leii]|uniref:ABC transporter domain-containing protein n=1 Tax=Aquatica leii TaxID=1421715 RepID=A0AAN7PJN1_9COLE|nr:hypothetical protein RN001_000142 [Aquatica leii]